MLPAAEQCAAQEAQAVGEAAAAAEAGAGEAAELAASEARMEGKRAAQEAEAAASEAAAAAEARAIEIAGSEAALETEVDGERPADDATETNDDEVMVVEVEDETDVPALVSDAAHEEEACAEPAAATFADEQASYKEAAKAVEDTDTDSDSFDVPILVQVGHSFGVCCKPLAVLHIKRKECVRCCSRDLLVICENLQPSM